MALPQSLISELTHQIQLARLVWERDKHTRTPVMLPHRLGRKYPDYQFSWSWAWLFPAHNICRDPRSGTLVRYRVHEANVQRAVKHASRKLGICVLPHCLRHGYATHCLEGGANPRAIQQAMGHSSLETTMGYTHAEALSVRSPLDTLPIILPVLAKRAAAWSGRNSGAIQPEGPNRLSASHVYPAQPNLTTRGCPPINEEAGKRSPKQERVLMLDRFQGPDSRNQAASPNGPKARCGGHR